MSLDHTIEALLFAADEPLPLNALCNYTSCERGAIQDGIITLKQRLLESSGLQLIELAGGYRLETKGDYYQMIKEMFQEKKASRLSMAALETLAMVAYKQPVTAVEIAEMRMVSSVSSILKNLLEKKLVKMAGRKKVVGRPMMYSTTKEFLIQFGLNNLRDLPSLDEFKSSYSEETQLPLEEGQSGHT